MWQSDWGMIWHKRRILLLYYCTKWIHKEYTTTNQSAMDTNPIFQFRSTWRDADRGSHKSQNLKEKSSLVAAIHSDTNADVVTLVSYSCVCVCGGGGGRGGGMVLRARESTGLIFPHSKCILSSGKPRLNPRLQMMNHSREGPLAACPTTWDLSSFFETSFLLNRSPDTLSRILPTEYIICTLSYPRRGTSGTEDFLLQQHWISGDLEFLLQYVANVCTIQEWD